MVYISSFGYSIFLFSNRSWPGYIIYYYSNQYKLNIMKKIAKLLCLTLALLMIFGCCGCGEKKLVMGTNASFPPYEFVDDKNNIVGIDAEIAKAVAEKMGYELEIKDMAFDSLIPAIQAGNGDIIAAGMWCEDPERIEKVDFSDVYYTGGKALLVRADDDRIASSADLTAEMKVASQLGTNYADEITVMAEEGKIKEAVILDRFDTCVMQLVNGDIDAVIAGSDVVTAYMKAQEGKVKIAGGIEDAEGFVQDFIDYEREVARHEGQALRLCGAGQLGV